MSGFCAKGMADSVTFALQLFMEVLLGSGDKAGRHEEIDSSQSKGLRGDDHMPSLPMLVPAEAAACQVCAATPRDKGGSAEAVRGNIPTDIADVGRRSGRIRIIGTQ